LERRTFGELSGPFFEPMNGSKPSQIIIFMHGWGADSSDLVELAWQISQRIKTAAFFLPDGPSICGLNPLGREWFDIDDKTNGPLKAETVINTALDEAIHEFELPTASIAVIGFSQGGMMALHCGLRRPEIGVVVSLSGSLLLYDDLAQQVDNKKYPPVLLVHGTDDVVVPFIMQEKSKAILDSLGVEVDVVVCHQLGHGINQVGISAAINFLEKYLP